jgi:hypothetical protein
VIVCPLVGQSNGLLGSRRSRAERGADPTPTVVVQARDASAEVAGPMRSWAGFLTRAGCGWGVVLPDLRSGVGVRGSAPVRGGGQQHGSVFPAGRTFDAWQALTRDISDMSEVPNKYLVCHALLASKASRMWHAVYVCEVYQVSRASLVWHVLVTLFALDASLVRLMMRVRNVWARQWWC